MSMFNIKTLVIVLFAFILFISSGYFYLNKSSQSESETIPFLEQVKEQIKEKPKPIAVNPLNGVQIFDPSLVEKINRFPVGVMVNNAVPARPQSGLHQADLIYEIVAEGGITRYLALYLSETPKMVGPIRSVREYYLPFVKENGNASLMHIGYSPQAFQKIPEWQVFSIGLKGADFYRDNHGNLNVATEHTAYSVGEDLFDFSQKLRAGETPLFESWKFKDSVISDKNVKDAKSVQIDFWYEGDYSAYFRYDETKNEYVRHTGVSDFGDPQILLDRETKNEIRVKNVIIQLAEEFPIPNDDKNRLDYKVIGSGKSYILLDGKVSEGTWKKESLTSRTRFFDSTGKEVELNRGKIWISIVPSRNESQIYFNDSNKQKVSN